MDHRALLTDAAERPLHATEQVLDGIDETTLHARPDDRGSSIAWLVWHAFRQQDVQVAALSGNTEVWEAGGWADRLGVPRGAGDFGFGDGPAEVAALRIADPAELLAYAVAHVAQAAYVRGLVEGWSIGY